MGYLNGASGLLLLAQSNDLKLTTTGATSMQFSTNGSERMRIDTSGNVGIGTSSPSYPLEVRQDGASTFNYIGSLNTTATGAFGAGFLARAGSGFSYFYMRGDGLAYVENATANPLAFATNGSEKMRIDSAGNVGIGTSAPTAPLHVKVATDRNLRILNAYSSVALGSLTDIGAEAPMTIYANPISFVTNNVERMRIDSSGNVGIGTGSPSTRLHIEGSGAELRVQSTAPQEGFIRFINTSGSMSVGMSGVAANELLTYDRTNSQNAHIYAGGASGYHVWYTTGNERMRIDNSGNLLVGTTDPGPSSGQGVKLLPTGRVYSVITSSIADSYDLYNTTAAAYRFYVDNAGTVFATSTTISAISDIRLKENVRDLDAGLDTILALKPRRFDWKAGKGKDVRDDMGFIAQEVEEVLPALIGGWKAGEGEPDDLKSVKAGDLIPVLVKAIQELTARVAQLEGK
jgi:hypothetical protein